MCRTRCLFHFSIIDRVMHFAARRGSADYSSIYLYLSILYVTTFTNFSILFLGKKRGKREKNNKEKKKKDREREKKR